MVHIYAVGDAWLAAFLKFYSAATKLNNAATEYKNVNDAYEMAQNKPAVFQLLQTLVNDAAAELEITAKAFSNNDALLTAVIEFENLWVEIEPMYDDNGDDDQPYDGTEIFMKIKSLIGE